MTLPGIITMTLSICFVWGLLAVCVCRLLRDPKEGKVGRTRDGGKEQS